MYNESAKNSSMKYRKANRDKLTIDFPKGDKERYKAYAESRGKSLTKLFIELIEADMQKHSEE